MKKLHIISFVLISSLLISKNSFAKNHFYLGADIFKYKVKHNYSPIAPSPTGSDPVEKVSRDNSFNDINRGYRWGLNAGYKANLCSPFFIAPEIFYDKIDSKAVDFYFFQDSTFATPEDFIKIKSRYGAKINLGYDIVPNLSVFVNAGLAKTSFSQTWFPVPGVLSNIQNYSSSKTSPIFGLGMTYNLNKNLAVKISYDFQRFSTKYQTEGYRDSIKLDTARIGAIYNF